MCLSVRPRSVKKIAGNALPVRIFRSHRKTPGTCECTLVYFASAIENLLCLKAPLQAAVIASSGFCSKEPDLSEFCFKLAESFLQLPLLSRLLIPFQELCRAFRRLLRSQSVFRALGPHGFHSTNWFPGDLVRLPRFVALAWLSFISLISAGHCMSEESFTRTRSPASAASCNMVSAYTPPLRW